MEARSSLKHISLSQETMTPVKDLSTEGDVPMAQINQVAEGIYRISSYAPDPDMSFNQFLIDDDKLIFYTRKHDDTTDTSATNDTSDTNSLEIY
jgi:hypothetical protein